jgi:hypothetical protein
MDYSLAGIKINYLIIFLFILALAGVIMGGFGVKAYSDKNNGINDTVNNLTVSNDLTVGRDTTMARNLGVTGTLAVTDNSTLTGTLGVTGVTTLTGGLVSLIGVNPTPVTDATLTAITKNEYILDRAAGMAITLPVAVDGSRISFVIKTAVTSGSITINTTSDFLHGYATILQTDNGVSNLNSVFNSTLLTGYTTMTLNNGTTGGLAGGIIELVGSNSSWTVRAQLYGSGTLASPFS